MSDQHNPLDSLTEIRTENRADFKELSLSESSSLLTDDIKAALELTLAFLPIKPRLYWFQQHDHTENVAIGAEADVSLEKRFQAVAKIAKFAPAWVGKALNFLPTLAIGGAFTPLPSSEGGTQAFAKLEVKVPSLLSLLTSSVATKFKDAEIEFNLNASLTSRESWKTSDVYSPIDEQIELETGATLSVRGTKISATVSRVSSTRTITTEIDGKVRTIVVEKIVTKVGNVDTGLLDSVGIHLGQEGRLVADEWFVYDYNTRRPLDTQVVDGNRLMVGSTLADPAIRDAISDLIGAEGGAVSGATDEEMTEIVVTATRNAPPPKRFEGTGTNAGLIVDYGSNSVVRQSSEPGVAKEIVLGGKGAGSVGGVVRQHSDGSVSADLVATKAGRDTPDQYSLQQDGSVTLNGTSVDANTARLIQDFVKRSETSVSQGSVYTPELRTTADGLELTIPDGNRTRHYVTDGKGLHIGEDSGHYDVLVGPRSVEIEIKGNPLGIDFSDVGGVIGQQLGYRLAGGNQLSGILYSSTLKTFGNNLGDALDEVVGGGSVTNAVNDAFDKFGDELADNIKAAGVGALASFLTAELVNALGLSGFAGDLTNTVGGSVIGQVINQLGTSNPFSGITSTATLGSAVGSFIGAKLANQVVSFDTIGGQLGSAIGSSLGVILAAKLALIGGPLGGPIGAAVGAFVGFIVGGLIGSIFGGTPRSGADVVWDESAQQFTVANVYARKGGSKDAAKAMASAAASTFNAVLTAAGGVLAAPEAVQAGNYGTRKKDFVYRSYSTTDENAISARYAGKNAAGKLIGYGVYAGLADADFQIIGGDTYVKRALYNTLESTGASSFDSNLLLGNLATAQSYEKYLANSTAINALLSNASETGFGAETSLLLVRAVDLGLNRRHRSDWFGGLFVSAQHGSG